MMFVIVLVTFTTIVVEAITVSAQINDNNEDQLVYTIQLATFPKDKKYIGVKYLNDLPSDIRSKSVLYPIGDYYALRYNPLKQRELLFDETYRLKDMGYTNAYIVQTSLTKFQEIQGVVVHKSSKSDLVSDSLENANESNKTKELTNYKYREILYLADSLNKTNQLIESMEQYEILFKSNKSNNVVNKNLFYLYGKTNNWERAKSNIVDIKRKDKLLYAYGLGALENYNVNLENELKPELCDDISGYVNLVLGVFKERQKNYQDAYNYYENAKNINRFDMFIMFAYARAFELIKKYDLAQKIYLDISLVKSDRYKNIKLQAHNRYIELKELSKLVTKE